MFFRPRCLKAAQTSSSRSSGRQSVTSRVMTLEAAAVQLAPVQWLIWRTTSVFVMIPIILPASSQTTTRLHSGPLSLRAASTSKASAFTVTRRARAAGRISFTSRMLLSLFPALSRLLSFSFDRMAAPSVVRAPTDHPSLYIIAKRAPRVTPRLADRQRALVDPVTVPNSGEVGALQVIGGLHFRKTADGPRELEAAVAFAVERFRRCGRRHHQLAAVLVEGIDQV